MDNGQTVLCKKCIKKGKRMSVIDPSTSQSGTRKFDSKLVWSPLSKGNVAKQQGRFRKFRKAGGKTEPPHTD